VRTSGTTCIHPPNPTFAAINFVKVCRGEMAPPCAAAEAVEDLKIARDYIRMWKGK
jgi:hypothetical protein